MGWMLGSLRVLKRAARSESSSDRKMVEKHELVIIGGGQAGLALSYYLRGLGLEQVILEQGRVGEPGDVDGTPSRSTLQTGLCSSQGSLTREMIQTDS
jgi:glycine/D-amino acid oxidase-like deaminating enzyme